MEPIDNPVNYRFGIFYFNKEDIRTVVPKMTRSFGYTLNFAQWKSYLFISAIIALFVVSAFI